MHLNSRSINDEVDEPHDLIDSFSLRFDALLISGTRLGQDGAVPHLCDHKYTSFCRTIKTKVAAFVYT